MNENSPNIDKIRTAAEGGNAKAQFQLAICYIKGMGVPRDFAQGVVWLQKAAEGGLAEAQYPMGLFTAEGKGVKQDKAASIKWFGKAAEQGHKDAQRYLAKIALVAYQETGSETAKAGALKWFKAAADQGDAEAKAELEKMLTDTADKIIKDDATIFERAEAGDVEAQYSLANAYQYGYGGVKKNMKAAAEWYRRAAEGGHMESQCNYGLCFVHGAGVKKDFTQAVVWFRKAALQGDALAQRYVGNAYANGDGVEVNKTEAAKWWKMAADQNDAFSQCNLADLLLAGDGVPQDKAEAARLYRLASEDDDWLALFRLGQCYLNGDGVDRDETEGMKCIKEAVLNGSPEATQWLEEEAEKGSEAAISAIQEINKAIKEEESASSAPVRAPEKKKYRSFHLEGMPNTVGWKKFLWGLVGLALLALWRFVVRRYF